MYFFRRILPNISIACSLALIVVAIFNNRNPMMGFLLSTPGLVLIISTCAVSVLSNAIAYGYARKRKKKRAAREYRD